MLNVRRIRRIHHHPVESNEASSPECISKIEDWLDWNGDLDNQNDSEDDSGADVQLDMKQNNSIEYLDRPEGQNASAGPSDPGLIWPTGKSKRQAETVLMRVNAIKTRRNKGVEKK